MRRPVPGRSSQILDLSRTGRGAWLDAFRQFPEADIYYHPGYAEILQRNHEGEARCLVVREGPHILLLPYMVREIPAALLRAAGIGSALYDTATPYGYGGPALHADSAEGEQQLVEEARRALAAGFESSGVVSEFVRFHPILENHRFHQAGLDLRRRSETVLFELSSDDDALLQGMVPQARNKTRRAERDGVRVQLDQGFEHLEEFYRNYISTMERAGAPRSYFHPLRFFHDHIEMLAGSVFLFLAWHGQRIVHSALILLQGPHAHYHFSGADSEHRVVGANNLLLLEVARWARGAGARTLHLGGGRTLDDSLFRFKASLSPARRGFWTGAGVHDSEAYARLSRAASAATGSESNPGFFPAYRQ